MALWDNIVLAVTSLRSRKMRALLTMLGIIIGIGSVIAIVTVGDSLTGTITDSMQGLGANNITVSLTQKSDDDESESDGSVQGFMFGRSSPQESDLITDEMLAEYENTFAGYIDAVTMTESCGSATVSQEANSSDVTISGVNLSYCDANDIELKTGRWLKQPDIDSKKKVCVVADTFVEDVFGTNVDVIGKTISLPINNTPFDFYIVGVYKTEESAFSFSDATTLYVPISTAKQLIGAADGYSSFTVMTVPGIDGTEFKTATQNFFSSFYTRNKSYTVQATSMEAMLETVTEMLDTVKLAIAAIAAISLVVGGIGVMNIMLVSITERTREIGTRKALGAPNSAIRMQFIVESMIICIIGGIIGIVLGILLGTAASGLLGYPAQPSVMWILIAVAFSMIIGVFFGFYPANKAAKMDPIDALRYE